MRLISILMTATVGMVSCWSPDKIKPVTFRQQIISGISKTTAPLGGATVGFLLARTAANAKEQFEYQPALQGLDYGKIRTVYPDFIQKKSGLQYKVVKEGEGKTPAEGDRVVLDWEGYTIGYYGRPFEARNKVKGGEFSAKKGEKDDEYFRFVLGSGTAIAAVNEAVQYMKEGGVMQIIVPAELGYPVKGDPEHDFVGPRPNTFSGRQALNFVLNNQNLIDKTLLINVRLVRVDKKGQFKA